jgi:hypothetical protein
MISTAKRKKDSAIMEKKIQISLLQKKKRKKETQTKSLYCKKEKKEKFVANEDIISMTKREKKLGVYGKR